MELTLTRTDFTNDSTIGELSVNGKFECFTFEDKVRPVKLKKASLSEKIFIHIT